MCTKVNLCLGLVSILLNNRCLFPTEKQREACNKREVLDYQHRTTWNQDDHNRLSEKVADKIEQL